MKEYKKSVMQKKIELLFYMVPEIVNHFLYFLK